MFKRSELPFLKLLFTILKTKGFVDIELSDVDIRFTRRNDENIQVKSQVLTTMLNNEKIHPKLAYESCGMFIDPEEAYNVSMEYYANNRRTEQPNDSNNTEPTANNGTDAEGNSTRFAT
jgi:hypothetical protein